MGAGNILQIWRNALVSGAVQILNLHIIFADSCFSVVVIGLLELSADSCSAPRQSTRTNGKRNKNTSWETRNSIFLTTSMFSLPYLLPRLKA